MKLLIIVLAIVGIALASVEENKHVKKVKHDGEHEVSYKKQYSYQGKYDGKCNKDGFYYKDAQSFVICSNNNAYVQPCAPGSTNSGYESFNSGATYYYRDFCDINLVDRGYGVNHFGTPDKTTHYGGHKQAVSYSKQYEYQGKYGGKCDNDGFYYRDDDSFVICSNSNAYVQPCAPGTRNSGYNNYHQGSAYNYRDFCDVNLVDHGYGAHYGGYVNKGIGYGRPDVHKRQDQYMDSSYGYGYNRVDASSDYHGKSY